MAKKNEAATTAETTALAKADENELLAAFLDEGGVDGLDEVDSSDIKIPLIVWNMKGPAKDGGEKHRVDQFFNLLTGDRYDSLTVVFVHLHKSREFSYFDDAKDEKVRVCSSQDQVTGVTRTEHEGVPAGIERACDTCPHANWKTNDKGKRVRDCDEVYGAFAVLLDQSGASAGEGALLRFKRTSLAPFRTHLQRHHIGRMRGKDGKPRNVPFFAFPVRLTLNEEKGGNYATPVFERLAVLPREQLAEYESQARYFREMAADAAAAAEKREDAAGVDAAGGEPNADDFV